MTKEELMRKAIELSTENVANGGGPFGAVIAKDGEIIDVYKRQRFPYNKNIELHNYFLTVPVLKNEEEVKQAQANILQTYPTPPKAVIIVGDPGWLVSAPIFDGPWKDIPVILCYSRKRVQMCIRDRCLHQTKTLTITNKESVVTLPQHLA